MHDLPAIEIIATLLNLAYVLLLMRNKVWAWPCGIIGSAIMAYSFSASEHPLYMETISYIVYTIMGFLGLYYWLKGKENNELPITDWSAKQHFIVILSGILVAVFIAYLLRFSKESRPLIDSFTTVFALIGTWMQARKILSNWWYWLVINLVSIYLYYSTGFYVYAVLAFVFTVLSISGLLSWKKIYNGQKI